MASDDAANPPVSRAEAAQYGLELRAEVLSTVSGGDSRRRGESDVLRIGWTTEESVDTVRGAETVRIDGDLTETVEGQRPSALGAQGVEVRGGLDLRCHGEVHLVAGGVNEERIGAELLLAGMTDSMVAGAGLRTTAPVDLWLAGVIGIEEKLGTAQADGALVDIAGCMYEREFHAGHHAAVTATFCGAVFTTTASGFRPLMKALIGVRNLTPGGGGGGGGGGGSPTGLPPPVGGSAPSAAAASTATATAVGLSRVADLGRVVRSADSVEDVEEASVARRMADIDALVNGAMADVEEVERLHTAEDLEGGLRERSLSAILEELAAMSAEAEGVDAADDADAGRRLEGLLGLESGTMSRGAGQGSAGVEDVDIYGDIYNMPEAPFQGADRPERRWMGDYEDFTYDSPGELPLPVKPRHYDDSAVDGFEDAWQRLLHSREQADRNYQQSAELSGANPDGLHLRAMDHLQETRVELRNMLEDIVLPYADKLGLSAEDIEGYDKQARGLDTHLDLRDALRRGIQEATAAGDIDGANAMRASLESWERIAQGEIQEALKYANALSAWEGSTLPSHLDRQKLAEALQALALETMPDSADIRIMPVEEVQARSDAVGAYGRAKLLVEEGRNPLPYIAEIEQRAITFGGDGGNMRAHETYAQVRESIAALMDDPTMRSGLPRAPGDQLRLRRDEHFKAGEFASAWEIQEWIDGTDTTRRLAEDPDVTVRPPRWPQSVDPALARQGGQGPVPVKPSHYDDSAVDGFEDAWQRLLHSREQADRNYQQSAEVSGANPNGLHLHAMDHLQKTRVELRNMLEDIVLPYADKLGLSAEDIEQYDREARGVDTHLDLRNALRRGIQEATAAGDIDGANAMRASLESWERIAQGEIQEALKYANAFSAWEGSALPSHLDRQKLVEALQALAAEMIPSFTEIDSLSPEQASARGDAAHAYGRAGLLVQEGRNPLPYIAEIEQRAITFGGDGGNIRAHETYAQIRESIAALMDNPEMYSGLPRAPGDRLRLRRDEHFKAGEFASAWELQEWIDGTDTTRRIPEDPHVTVRPSRHHADTPGRALAGGEEGVADWVDPEILPEQSSAGPARSWNGPLSTDPAPPRRPADTPGQALAGVEEGVADWVDPEILSEQSVAGPSRRWSWPLSADPAPPRYPADTPGQALAGVEEGVADWVDEAAAVPVTPRQGGQGPVARELGAPLPEAFGGKVYEELLESVYGTPDTRLTDGALSTAPHPDHPSRSRFQRFQPDHGRRRPVDISELRDAIRNRSDLGERHKAILRRWGGIDVDDAVVRTGDLDVGHRQIAVEEAATPGAGRRGTARVTLGDDLADADESIYERIDDLVGTGTGTGTEPRDTARVTLGDDLADADKRMYERVDELVGTGPDQPYDRLQLERPAPDQPYDRLQLERPVTDQPYDRLQLERPVTDQPYDRLQLERPVTAPALEEYGRLERPAPAPEEYGRLERPAPAPEEYGRLERKEDVVPPGWDHAEDGRRGQAVPGTDEKGTAWTDPGRRPLPPTPDGSEYDEYSAPRQGTGRIDHPVMPSDYNRRPAFVNVLGFTASDEIEDGRRIVKCSEDEWAGIQQGIATVLVKDKDGVALDSAEYVLKIDPELHGSRRPLETIRNPESTSRAGHREHRIGAWASDTRGSRNLADRPQDVASLPDDIVGSRPAQVDGLSDTRNGGTADGPPGYTTQRLSSADAYFERFAEQYLAEQYLGEAADTHRSTVHVLDPVRPAGELASTDVALRHEIAPPLGQGADADAVQQVRTGEEAAAGQVSLDPRDGDRWDATSVSEAPMSADIEPQDRLRGLLSGPSGSFGRGRGEAVDAALEDFIESTVGAETVRGGSMDEVVTDIEVAGIGGWRATEEAGAARPFIGEATAEVDRLLEELEGIVEAVEGTGSARSEVGETTDDVGRLLEEIRSAQDVMDRAAPGQVDEAIAEVGRLVDGLDRVNKAMDGTGAARPSVGESPAEIGRLLEKLEGAMVEVGRRLEELEDAGAIRTLPAKGGHRLRDARDSRTPSEPPRHTD